MVWWKYAAPGDRVVCVETEWHYIDEVHVGFIPEEGSVYTIREVVPLSDEEFGFLITLMEAAPDEAFRAKGFRPVDPKSTEPGMKMIRKLLDSVPVKEDA